MSHNRFAAIVKIIVPGLIAALVFCAPTGGNAQSAMNLVANYVEVTPGEDGVSYGVNVYISVVDADGAPIKDLTAEAFTILEDGQKVAIQDFRLMAEEPTNIVLVMDTSRSMAGTGITDAIAAATIFVSGLKPNDQVALLTFDDQVKTRADFTTDHDSVIEQVKALKVPLDSGTCLYDAAFSAVNMFSSHPPGSRAVILFTDGKDETVTGALCSKNPIETAIALASEGELRTPIFTVGLGLEKQIDSAGLRNFAEQTGGYYLNPADSSKLANAFQTLSDQLRAQYILTYKSISAPGNRILTVSIGAPTQGQVTPENTDTRKFSLPALSPHLSFVAPLEGETVADALKIAVSLASQGQTLIQRVAFEVNGVEAGSDDITPYEFELDASQYPVGVMTISAIAYGADNTIVTRSSVNVVHSAPAEVAESVPTAEIAAPVPAPAPASIKPLALVGIGLGALAITAIILLILNLMRQQKKAAEEESNEYEENIVITTKTRTPPRPVPAYDRNMPGELESSSDALGALVVEASDDESMVGHRFEIISERTTIGRSAENDINFPRDTPVSRRHAEILQIDGKLYLKQVASADSSGTAAAPKYGTSINQTPLGLTPYPLSNGDEILLGRRVRLRFAAYEKATDIEELTRDEMDPSEDSDKTQEQ